jgi:diketogulonate reductase-like aldo/keto reductase
MTVIDTAEMYGEGLSEQLVGEAIQGIRDQVFLVSKVYPHNAGLKRVVTSCEMSLKRLRTDHLDLYLLHWRGSVPLIETIEGMEKLIRDGKIRRWGVSNLDMSDMKELLRQPGGERCSTNQVLYHLGSRGIEYDLLPWQEKNSIPVMAYCPLAQAGVLRRGLMSNAALNTVASRHEATPAQILLAWCTRHPNVLAIPKAADLSHVKENAAAAAIHLTDEDLSMLDAAFPPPVGPTPLEMV